VESPDRPPSAMKELHEAIVKALQESVQAAVAIEDLPMRSLALERCAQAWAHIDQAMTARITARVQELKLQQERR